MPYWLHNLINIAVSIFVTIITGPLFFATCGASSNMVICYGIKVAIFFGTYFILKFIFGPKKKKN
ncbi:hypothetical protein A2366_00930 [Candidatus Woesebacteria bacterium RIFOXYB1_FULL_33_9]|nr:MAG: hypothetical protein A2366_00930 [Candidatus Woesebacteria bacterium RIFOXYB1_FULL_33_9]